MDDGVIVWDFKEKEDSSQGDGQAHIWWGGGGALTHTGKLQHIMYYTIKREKN